MKKRMRTVCMALAVVGLASGAMAERECRRPIEGASEKQRQERLALVMERLALSRKLYLSGKRLYCGIDCDRDLAAAARQYRKAADMGHVRAQYSLSVCYHNGHGVGRNMKLAAAWCKRAANHGHPLAMFTMGVYRHSGMGGVTNAAEACRWFRLAARHGIGDPDFESGLDESEGCGREASLAWIANRAEEGDANAIYWYSRCLARGWGVPRDDSAARELLLEASSLGHSVAKCMVGRDKWYGRLPGGRDEGLKLVQEAEEQGNATAYRCLENLERSGGL